MAQAAGYVLNVAGARRAELLDAIELGGTLAEAVPEFTHSRNAPLIGFIGFKKKAITHIADARRGLRAGTGLRRVNLRDLIELPTPITHAKIANQVERRLRSQVATRLERGGLLPPATFAAVVDAVRALSPSVRPVLDRFSQRRRDQIARLSPHARRGLAYQKETVATALALAGLDRRALQAWEPKEAGVSSFLDGLAAARMREDAMVVNDMVQVPGFELVRTMPYGAAVFEGESTRLTVVLANRLPLEEQLGADLIYCNETYRAFTIVQYKAMEKTDNGFVFRLPDPQLAEEVARMRRVLDELRNCPVSTELRSFRLMDNPFFLKLCPRLIFNPDDMGLVPGMYLPLDYWHLVEADKSLVGPRGGHLVTYENVGRYFDNTGFVALVAKAWIGTTTQQSQALEPIIRGILEAGRALTVAIKADTKRPPPSDVATVGDTPLEPEEEQQTVRIFL